MALVAVAVSKWCHKFWMRQFLSTTRASEVLWKANGRLTLPEIWVNVRQQVTFLFQQLSLCLSFSIPLHYTLTSTWAGQLQYDAKLHMRICTVSALHFLSQSTGPPICGMFTFKPLHENGIQLTLPWVHCAEGFALLWFHFFRLSLF